MQLALSGAAGTVVASVARAFDRLVQNEGHFASTRSRGGSVLNKPRRYSFQGLRSKRRLRLSEA